MGQPLQMATTLSGLKTSPAPTPSTMKRSSLRLPCLHTKPLKGSPSLIKTRPRSKINSKPLKEQHPKKQLSLSHLKKRRIQTLQPRAKSANKRRRVLKRALDRSRLQTQWVELLLRSLPQTKTIPKFKVIRLNVKKVSNRKGYNPGIKAFGDYVFLKDLSKVR